MTDLWLTPEEVETLTARKRHKAQCVMLAKMGIPFKPNAIGRPLVERSAVCSNPGTPKKKGKPQPNWEAMDKAA